MTRLALSAMIIALAAGCTRESVHPVRPPVIIISIDTLRADHLPAYGYRNVTTPNIDALAHDGIVFQDAWSHCPLTLPSHASIFTGLRPAENGVHDNIGYTLDSHRYPTLATLLKAQGYETGAVVSAYVLRRSTGIDAGFDSYDDDIPFIDGAPAASLRRSGTESVRLARNWLSSRGDRPFLFFLHLYEPHAPYTPAPPFDRIPLPYDGAIATADALVGDLLADLRQRKLYDNAIIVLLSDHGEGLMDHGEQEHGILLYREALHVPLIIKLPRNTGHGTRDRDEVQLTDVLPTLLAILEIPPPVSLSGSSLLGSMHGDSPLPQRAILSETLYPRIHLGWSELQSAVRHGMQFIDSPHPELYDFAHDPAERRNVLGEQRRIAVDLSKALQSDGTRFNQPNQADREEAAKLAALGYLTSSPPLSSSPIDPKEHLGELNDLKDATEAMNRRDVARAIPLLETLLERNPGWSDVRDQLGDAQERKGDYPAAIRLYQEGMKRNPSLAGDFALSIASLLLRQRQFEPARAHAQLAMRANAPGAHQMLAEIALAQSDFVTAEREAHAAASFPTQALEAELLLGRIARARGDLDGALHYFEHVRQTTITRRLPPPSNFDFLYGDALARRGRVPEAEAAFTREIQRHPDDLDAYSGLALLQLMLDRRRDAALRTLDTMCANNPGAAARHVASDDLQKWGQAAEAARFR